MRSLNSPEFIANQFTRYTFNNMNLFDVVPTLEKLTVENLQDAFATFSDESGAYSLFNCSSRKCAMTEQAFLRRSWCIRRHRESHLPESRSFRLVAVSSLQCKQ